MSSAPQEWMTVGTLEYCLAAAIGGAALVEDLARRTISNWWPLLALAGGLACQLWAHGWMGFVWAIAGAASGFAVFLVFYLLGGMGGGDVKLMAGFGAMLGAGRLLQAAFWTALVGGILAAVVLGVSAVRARGNGGTRGALSIPYAPAIAAGVLLALLSAKT